MIIAIIAAMEEELAPIQNQLTNSSRQTIGSAGLDRGQISGIEVVLVHAKIGKVNAAVATTLAIQLYQPICMINVGTLAALDLKYRIGSIVLAESMAYHDVDVTKFGYKHGQIPRMPLNYSSSHALLNLFEKTAQENKLVFHRGSIATGDQFIAHPDQLNRIQAMFPNVIAVDMETAAIAHVAHLFNIPFISVRGVTDHANNESTGDFFKNLLPTAQIVGQLILSCIPTISHAMISAVTPPTL